MLCSKPGGCFGTPGISGLVLRALPDHFWAGIGSLDHAWAGSSRKSNHTSAGNSTRTLNPKPIPVTVLIYIYIYILGLIIGIMEKMMETTIIYRVL